MKNELEIKANRRYLNKLDAALILPYAGMLALIFSVVFIIALILDLEQVVWLRFINYFFYFPVTYMAIKKIYGHGDKIDYFTGLVTGFLICFIGQLIYVLLFFIYLHFNEPLVTFISSQMPTQPLLYPKISISFILLSEGFAWSAIGSFAIMQFFKTNED